MKKAIVFILIVSLFMQFGITSIAYADGSTAVSVAAEGKTRIDFINYTSGYRANTGGNALEIGPGNSICIRKNDYVLYDINVETAGNYKLTIATAYPTGTPSKPISVSSGDKLLGKCDIANTGSWGVSGEVSADEIYLEEGLQTLKFTNTTDAYFFYFILERHEIIVHDVASSGETKVEFENYSIGFDADGADTSVLEIYSNEALSGGSSVALTNAGDYASFKFDFKKSAVYNIRIGASCVESVTGEDVSIKKSSEIMAKTDLVNTGDVNTVEECDFGEYYFEEGINDLLIETRTDALFDYIIIEYVRETLKIEAENFTSSKGVENYGTMLSFNTNNWVDYAVTVEKDGFYSVDMYSGLDPSYAYDSAGISVYFDGVVALTGTINKTTAWTDYRQFNMGSAYMEAGDHVIRFQVTSGANWFDRFVIDYEGNALDLKSVTANGRKVSENGFVFRGCDYFELEFSQAVEKRYITNETIYITDGEKNIAADLLQDGKKIGIVLKETLDFDKEYTIYVKKVKDLSGRLSLDETSFVFKTYNEDNDGGEAFLSDIKATIKYEVITVEGKMCSSKSSLISGRQAEIYIGGESTALASAISNKDGSFSISYTLPEGTEEGKINLLIGGEYVTKNALPTLIYVSQGTEQAIIEELELDASAEEIANTFLKYEQELGIDILEDTNMLADLSKVFDSVEKTDISSYSVEDIIDLYYTYIAVEAINQAQTAGEIEAVLADEGMCEKLSIDAKKVESLTDNKSQFVSDVLALEEIRDADGLISTVSKILDGIVAEQNGKNGKALSGNNEISAYTGMGLDLPISFTEKFSGMRRIVFEIKGGDDTILNDAEVIKKTYGDIVTKANGNELTVIYTPRSSDFVVSDIAVLRVTLRDVVGERNISISGYVEYDEGLEFLIEEPIAEKNIKITVTENTNTPSRDESYVSGVTPPPSSEKPSGGTPSGNQNDNKPTEPDDKVDIDKDIPFDDLAEVKWAEECILNLVELDIISKSEDKKFNPQNNTKREEIVKMIVEAFGVYNSDAKADFVDVPSDAWYYTYAASAKAAGLVTGTDKGEFMSGSYITREDVATMVWRALEKKGYKAAENFEEFADDESISQYAKAAVYTMRELGIINGMGDNNFAPKTYVTRAQAAKMIYETVRMVTK